MKRILCSTAIAVSLGMASSSAMGAGFSLIEQSVTGLGTAYSGGAATADDPSTIYYNPAGMVLLKGINANANLHYIMPTAKFNKTGAANVLGAPIAGSDGSGNAGVAKVLPNLYVTRKIGDRLAVGLGINAPFGMATEYDKDWVGRYHAVDSDVKTININPAVAWRINDQWSIGAGFNAQYMDARLSSMVDFGLKSGVTAIASNPNADVFGDMNADSWGYGYNLGVLFIPASSTRFGVAYRSEVKQSLKGDVDFTTQNPAFLTSINPALTAAAALSFPDQGIKGNITLPDTLSISGYHRFNPAWAVMADVTWTGWSSFEKLVIKFDNGVLPDSVTTENWKDNWRYSAGLVYSPTDRLDLRFGLAFDETPVPDAKHRTPRIPDEDRFWTAVGLGYKISDRVSCDLGYAHLFVKDADIHLTDPSRGTLVGTYDNMVDIVSAQLTMTF